MPEEKEVLIDFEGKNQSQQTKVLIAEDSYQGTIKAVDLVDVPVYDKPNAMEKKIVFQIQLVGEGSDNALLPMYVRPSIRKVSRKGYNNSKLYDLLELAGELGNAMKQHEALETYEGLVGFLDARFKERKCKALVKVRNKGSENSYSTIGNIIRFEPVRSRDAETEEILK